MLTKEECIKALRGLEMIERAENFEKWGGQVAPQIKCDVIEQLIKEHFELVEKATPKKPIEKSSFASGYKCPNCESNIVLHGSHEICPTPCCSWCGQALDWSEEDESN